MSEDVKICKKQQKMPRGEILQYVRIYQNISWDVMGYQGMSKDVKIYLWVDR